MGVNINCGVRGEFMFRIMGGGGGWELGEYKVVVLRGKRVKWVKSVGKYSKWFHG